MAFEARLNVDPTPGLLFLWLRVALDCELKVEVRPCGQKSDSLQDSFEYVDGALVQEPLGLRECGRDALCFRFVGLPEMICCVVTFI